MDPMDFPFSGQSKHFYHCLPSSSCLNLIQYYRTPSFLRRTITANSPHCYPTPREQIVPLRVNTTAIMFFKRNSAFTLLLLLGTSVRDTFTMPSSLIPLVPRMGNLPSKMTSTVLNAFKSEGIQISKVLVSNLSPVSNGYAFSIHSKAKDAAKKPIWARNCVHAPSDPFGWDNCGRTGKQATAQTEPLYDDVWSRIKIIGGATVNEAAQRVQTATNMVEKSLNNARQANLNALNAAKQQPDSARTKELQHAATAADIREASARQELVEAKVFRAQQSTERKFKVALIFHFENQ